MLEEIAVLTARQSCQEARRGQLSADVAAEFPSIAVTFAEEVPDEPHVRASEWDSPAFDNWSFDVKVDRLSCEPFVLRAHDDRGERPDFALEVLNRCQRAIGRRNAYSQCPMFDRVLRRHRLLHDCTQPFERANYNHSLDTWQWLLRLDTDASLAVQIAALFHDVGQLKSEMDRAFAQSGHGVAVADRQLIEAGVPQSVRHRVAEIVIGHERCSEDAEVALLNDADALSWLSLDSPRCFDSRDREDARSELLQRWLRMRPSAREKLRAVKLRDDVREMMREVA